MPTAAETNVPKPIISDKLHILNQEQIAKINHINKQLMKKDDNQQIWIITTNKTPAELQTTKVRQYFHKIEQKSPSITRFSISRNPLAYYYAHQYFRFKDQMTSFSPGKDLIFSDINMIIIDPNLPYQFIPVASEDFMLSVGDFQNLFLGFQMNFHDPSSQNIMRTVEIMNKFIRKNHDGSYTWAVFTFGDALQILGMLLVFLLIVRWFIKHWNTPLGRGPYSDDREDNYDSGYLDGHYIGLHENDDHDDH